MNKGQILTRQVAMMRTAPSTTVRMPRLTGNPVLQLISLEPLEDIQSMAYMSHRVVLPSCSPSRSPFGEYSPQFLCESN